jgi:outer membrane lipoprotein-sorting protein
MKRNRMAILLCVMLGLFCGGCGVKTGNSISAELSQTVENYDTEDAKNIEEKSEAESIQDEIANVELQSWEYEPVGNESAHSAVVSALG